MIDSLVFLTGGNTPQAVFQCMAMFQIRISKEVFVGSKPLEQRCSVLYLLLRLTGKMRVSHDGHTRFIRQESGQVFADGHEQKACSISQVAAGIYSFIYYSFPPWEFVFYFSFSQMPQNTKSSALQQTWRK